MRSVILRLRSRRLVLFLVFFIFGGFTEAFESVELSLLVSVPLRDEMSFENSRSLSESDNMPLK